jgi:hypothetical protein
MSPSAPVATALADHLFDAEMVPDPGSVNSAGAASGRPKNRKSTTGDF